MILNDILYIQLKSSNWLECQKTVLEKISEANTTHTDEGKVHMITHLLNFTEAKSWTTWFSLIDGGLAQTGYDEKYINEKKANNASLDIRDMNYFVKLVIIEHLVPLDLSEEDMKIYTDFAKESFNKIDIKDKRYNLLILLPRSTSQRPHNQTLGSNP